MNMKIPFWMMCGAALGVTTCGIIDVAAKGSVKATEVVAEKLGAAYEDFNVHDGWILPDSYTTRKLVDSIASDVAELEKRKFKFPDEGETLALLQNATRRLVKLHDRLIEEYKQSKGLKGAYPPCDNYGHVSPIDKRLVLAQEHLKGAKDHKCEKDCPYNTETKCPLREKKGDTNAPPKITPLQFR